MSGIPVVLITLKAGPIGLLSFNLEAIYLMPKTVTFRPQCVSIGDDVFKSRIIKFVK